SSSGPGEDLDLEELKRKEAETRRKLLEERKEQLRQKQAEARAKILREKEQQAAEKKDDEDGGENTKDGGGEKEKEKEKEKDKTKEKEKEKAQPTIRREQVENAVRFL